MPHIKRLLQIQNDKAVYWSILLNSERVKRIFLFTKRIYNCFSSFGLLEYNILQTKQSIRNWTEFPLCLEHLQDRYLKQTEATSSRRTLYSPCCRKGRRTVRDPSVWSLSIRVLSSWGQSTHDNHFSEATTLNTYTLYVFIFNMNWGGDTIIWAWSSTGQCWSCWHFAAQRYWSTKVRKDSVSQI